MPTYASLQASRQNSPFAKNLNLPMDTCGALVFFQAVYTIVSTETIVTNDIIDLLDLPIGAQLLPETVRVSTDGLGGTGTVVASLGDAVSANRYSSTTVAVVSAGTTALTPTNAIMSAPFVITSATQRLKATITITSGTLTTGRVLRVSGFYVMAND